MAYRRDFGAPDQVVHGSAPGADALCGSFAEHVGIPVLPMPADWGARGNKAAGPNRNRAMCDHALTLAAQGHSVMLLAFEGGGGTAHMLRVWRDAGLPWRLGDSYV
jgi:hypothetical protein